jgi:hypothetical protein
LADPKEKKMLVIYNHCFIIDAFVNIFSGRRWILWYEPLILARDKSSNVDLSSS